MMVFDWRVRPPSKKGMLGFFERPGLEAGYSGVYSGQHADALMADSPLLKGQTWREAIMGLFDVPLSKYLEFLDDAGVDKIMTAAADSQSQEGGRFFSNEDLAELVNQYPDRLIGFAGVDPMRGMDAVRQLESAVKELRLKGLALSPWEYNLCTNDKKLYPLYAKCAELGVPVNVHCSINFSLSRRMDLTHPRYLDEVACDFPELKLVANHGGWPWVPELVATAWRHRNVYISFSNIRPRYIGMPNAGWDLLLQYGNTIIQDQVIFGSNWPNMPIKRNVQEVLDLPLKDSVKEKWLYKNAARVMGLE